MADNTERLAPTEGLFEGVKFEKDASPTVDLFAPEPTPESRQDKVRRIVDSRKPAHEILLEEVNSENNPLNFDNWKDGSWQGGNLLKAILSPTLMSGIKAVDIPIRRAFATVSNPMLRLQDPEQLLGEAAQGKTTTAGVLGGQAKILGKEMLAGITGKRQANFADVYRNGGLPDWAAETLGFVNEMTFLTAASKNPITKTLKDMRKGGAWQLSKYKAGKETLKDFKNLYGSAWDDVDDVIDKVVVDSGKVDDVILKNLKGLADDVLEKIDRVVGGGFAKNPGAIDTGKKLKDVIKVLDEVGFKNWVKTGKTAGKSLNKAVGAASKHAPLKQILYDALKIAEDAKGIPKGTVKHIKKLNSFAASEYYPTMETLLKKFSSVDSFESFIKSAGGQIARHQAKGVPSMSKKLVKLGADKKLSAQVIKQSSKLIKEVGSFRRQRVIQSLLKVGVPSYILYKGLNAMNNTLKKSGGGGGTTRGEGGGVAT